MPNATVRANARPMPDPKPGSVASIRRQTANLKSATALLKAAKVVEREGARAAAKRKVSRKARPVSQYERYPLPFFDGERHLTWAARPTGRYDEDCETGHAFAIEFLKSNDGTNGWAALLGSIVTDMINAGPMPERWGDGTPHANGLVIGFMRVIGITLCASRRLTPAIIDLIAKEADRDRAALAELRVTQ